MYSGPPAKLHTTKQTGSRIPPGIGLHGCVHINCDAIIRTKSHIICQIHVKWRISIMLQTHFISIDFHSSIHHGTIDLQPDTAAFPFLRYPDILRIIRQITGKITHICLCRRIRRHRSSDHTVMRQIHRFTRIRLKNGEGIQQPSAERPFFI